MSEDLRRLKAQQEANSAAIARMQMMMQAQNARHAVQEDDDDDGDQVPPAAQGYPPQQQQVPQQQPQYQQVDPNQLVLQAITNQAAQNATRQVQQNLTATADVESKIKARMSQLVANYPALTDENSALVVKSREIYARVAHENPGLDEATRYELAVERAAAQIGARPVNAPIEDIAAADFVMPVGRNPAIATRSGSGKNFLTDKIIANAKMHNINVDPSTPEGKKNLAELNAYSERFKANTDEDQYRYR